MEPVGFHPLLSRQRLQLHIPRQTGQIQLGFLFTSVTFSPYLHKIKIVINDCQTDT